MLPFSGVTVVLFLKKNLKASRPSVNSTSHKNRGENVKTFRWDHRLQRQNCFVTTVAGRPGSSEVTM